MRPASAKLNVRPGYVSICFRCEVCCEKSTPLVKKGVNTPAATTTATDQLWRKISKKHGSGVCDARASERVDNADDAEDAGDVGDADDPMPAPADAAARPHRVAVAFVPHNIPADAIRDRSAHRDEERARAAAARRVAGGRLRRRV